MRTIWQQQAIRRELCAIYGNVGDAALELHDSNHTKIALHHVGARSGGTRLFHLPTYEDDFITVLYEADVDAIKDLGTKVSPGDVVLPYCLGAIDGMSVLHIAYCPCMSSLYPITDVTDEITEVVNGFDYRIARTGRTMERREVQQYRLDSLAEIRTGLVPPPTILSMDTQGSEPDIVRGAMETIRKHTLAIQTEVEFTEYYKGQLLFGELAKTLDELGFIFVGLFREQRTLVSRQPLGFRGGGFTTGGDALFIRRISSVTDSPAQLLKLGLISLTLGHFDYAFEAWSRMPPAFLQAGPHTDRKFTVLVEELLSAYDETPHLFPKEFEDFYSWEASRARFEPSSKAMFATLIADARRRVRESVLANDREALIYLNSTDDVLLEKVLRTSGLGDLADKAKDRRLFDVGRFLSAVGLERTGQFSDELKVNAANGWPRYRLRDDAVWPGQ